MSRAASSVDGYFRASDDIVLDRFRNEFGCLGIAHETVDYRLNKAELFHFDEYVEACLDLLILDLEKLALIVKLFLRPCGIPDNGTAVIPYCIPVITGNARDERMRYAAVQSNCTVFERFNFLFKSHSIENISK